MNVRKAEPKDVEAIVQLGREMQEASSYSIFNYDVDKCIKTINYSFEEDPLVLFQVCEDHEGICGFMGASCVAGFFTNDRTVSEMAFYILPEKRSYSLAREFTKGLDAWAEEKGAVMTTIGSTANLVDDRYMDFLKKTWFCKSRVCGN